MLNLLCAALILQSPENRAAELVAKMTTTEKIGQLMMDAPAIPRLGVPAYHWWNEALHGIARNGVATVFPQAIGLSATWDTDLMHQVATAISTEARAKNNQNPNGIYHGITLWSPNVNIFRDPRWGRGHETYGEDPFLTGRMGVAFVTGIQGDGPYLRAVATPKHFAVHSGPEPLRHQFDAVTPERDVMETYLPAFEACIREGHAQSTMAAYSAFNGVPATGNHWLLTDLLRNTWGFDGAVVSDVDSVHDLWAGHKAAKDAAEASAMALKAGDDLCSGDTYRALPEALKRGLVTEADLDRAATRLFTLRYRLGMFDKIPYQQIPASEIDSPAHDALNFEAAKKCLVLLKNDGALPFGPSIKKLAVIGPTADDLGTLVGNYNGDPSHPVTILSGLKKRADVTYARGCALAEKLDDGHGPFPRGSLFTDADQKTPGLKREVFAGKDLSGTPLLTSTSTGINLRWTPPSSPRGIPATDVSIRWTGVFVPPTSGPATLGLAGDDGVRLYIDDKLVVDDWSEGAERPHAAKVELVKGEPVKLRVEFFQAAGDAVVQLGYSVPNGPDLELEEAVQAAQAADAVVLTLGITPGLEGEEMNVNAVGFKGGDRTAIELPKPQRNLLARISKLGKPVVVVLTGGSALSLDTKAPNAILDQWYSGGRGGDAVAAALFGDFSPAGRLPLTFYRATTDLPPFENYSMAGRTYRYFAGKPLFPFGYGLSYTKFTYGKPSIEPLGIVAGNTYRVKVKVTNTGGRDGEEVVQFYARAAKPLPGDARHSLVGFQRVAIPKGTTKEVSLTLPVQRLRVWNPAKKAYEVRPGEYTIETGASSADIRGTAKLTIN